MSAIVRFYQQAQIEAQQEQLKQQQQQLPIGKTCLEETGQPPDPSEQRDALKKSHQRVG